MAGDWRYILQAMDGSGTPGAILHPDLPLTGVSITEGVNATDELTASITPYSPAIKDALTQWGACIWAEASGKIRGGGILVHTETQGSSLSLECMGVHGYAYGMPYTGSVFFVEEDPFDIYRHIWEHIQAKAGGNVGLQIPSLTSPVRIGQELQQVEFDTEEGPVSFEAGPYKLNWYDTHDLGKNIDDLASDTPFEFRELKEWDPTGTFVNVSMELAYPRFSRRRTDLRFVVGENVIVSPKVAGAGDDYGNELLLLGAGEGRTMIRGQASMPRNGRLRRVIVEEHKDVKSITTANTRAYNLLKARLELGDLTELNVIDHPNAPLGSVRAGDEILAQLGYDWQEDEQYWVRVQTITYSPDEGNNYVLNVLRSDKVA